MQQIADWLEKLGMSEYAQRFAENRIDFSVLRDLTDQDLKELGVVLGDRRKMLRAIAAKVGVSAAGAPAPVTTYVTPEPAALPVSGTAEVTGERRCHGGVLRSRGLDQHFRAARCRGVARPRQRLSRCRLRRRDRNGRPCSQEVGRRANGAVWLSGGAGERRRTGSAGRALDSTGARRSEPQEYCCWQASTQRTHRD